MKDTLFHLQGKRALITGASRGIGFHLSLAFAEFDAEVTAVARTHADLEKLSQTAAQKNLRIETSVLDVNDRNKVASWMNERSSFQILVNNAGINIPQKAVEVSEENFDTIFNLNVKATFFLATSVAKRLIAEKLDGSIITISSQMGHIGGKERSVYCASKHAVEGFTKAMAWEWGKFGIRINTICPTFIKTPLTEPFLKKEGFYEETVSNIALERIGKIEEVIGPAIFLASDASSLVTGTALMVDGGWTAR